MLINYLFVIFMLSVFSFISTKSDLFKEKFNFSKIVAYDT